MAWKAKASTFEGGYNPSLEGTSITLRRENRLSLGFHSVDQFCEHYVNTIQLLIFKYDLESFSCFPIQIRSYHRVSHFLRVIFCGIF
jgi:hypothetical protein